jgi:hypothetical protein
MTCRGVPGVGKDRTSFGKDKFKTRILFPDELFLLWRKEFFAFAENSVYCLSWTGIQAEATRFHAP